MWFEILFLVIVGLSMGCSEEELVACSPLLSLFYLLSPNIVKFLFYLYFSIISANYSCNLNFFLLISSVFYSFNASPSSYFCLSETVKIGYLSISVPFRLFSIKILFIEYSKSRSYFFEFFELFLCFGWVLVFGLIFVN